MTAKRCMKAPSETNLEALSFPLIAQPKIDGVRATIQGGKLLSKSLKPIPNDYIQRCLSNPLFEGLDGELEVNESYNSTVSAVMRKKGEPVFTFHIFDKISPDRFLDRYKQIEPIPNLSPHISLVPNIVVRDFHHLLEVEEEYLYHEYEGLMLRNNGLYKHGICTQKEGYLLKMKRFYDSEATIIDYEALKRNDNAVYTDEEGFTRRSTKKAGKVEVPLLGAFICKSPDFYEPFRVGSGFSLKQRKYLWLIRNSLPSLLIKYKYQKHGTKNKPRQPIFLGFRSPLDMD